MPKPEGWPAGKTGRERLITWQVTSAEAQFGGQTVTLDPQTVEGGLGELMDHLEEQLASEHPEVTIRIVVTPKD